MNQVVLNRIRKGAREGGEREEREREREERDREREREREFIRSLHYAVSLTRQDFSTSIAARHYDTFQLL